jgi:hypothetical protein
MIVLLSVVLKASNVVERPPGVSLESSGRVHTSRALDQSTPGQPEGVDAIT